MTIRRFIALLAISSICILSCKKKGDDIDTNLSFTGKVSINIPTYVARNEIYSFDIDTLVSLSRSDEQGDKVGYYISNPTTGKRDTIYYDGHILNEAFPDAVYHFKTPSELKSANLMIVGFSKGYYERSSTASFTVVDPRLDGKGSITGFSILPDQKLFVDPRDGHRYYTVEIDGTEWMRTNLTWTGAGVPYCSSKAMSRVYGQFYTWHQAQTACPAGWRLTSDKDWAAVASKYGTLDPKNNNYDNVAASLMEEISFNGTALWDYWPNVKINNASSLSIFPTGYATLGMYGFEFNDNNYYAMFWTSDGSEDEGVYRYICEDKNTLFYGRADKDAFAINVRCVR